MKDSIIVRTSPGAPYSFSTPFSSTTAEFDSARTLKLGDDANDWHSVDIGKIKKRGNRWDIAHSIVNDPAIAILGDEFAEPDFVQEWPWVKASESEVGTVPFGETFGEADPPSLDWPFPNRLGWHLDDDYSQLRSAREEIGDLPDDEKILIGILDTGYDANHCTVPAYIQVDKEHDFVGGGNRAIDPGMEGLLKNPGHGTGTLGILAGNEVELVDPRPGGSETVSGFLGGAPFCKVAAVRIANSVIHFKGSAMAEGIAFALDQGCDVVSISMGGVGTKAWAAAVNRAYDEGMVIVAAAGNNVGGFPTKRLVYPAKFERVIAVCGATSENLPYNAPGMHRKMQGNYGPGAKMGTAIAAFTPNSPWAEWGSQKVVDLDGAGTSSATPQVAAAAALWLQKYSKELSRDWKRVEHVRHALFSTADKSYEKTSKYFGNGLLRAKDALEVTPIDEISKSSDAKITAPWAQTIIGFDAQPVGVQQMLETETSQLINGIFGPESPEKAEELLTEEEPDDALKKRFIEEVFNRNLASEPLKELLEKAK